jgi:hypothetical protein
MIEKVEGNKSTVGNGRRRLKFTGKEHVDHPIAETYISLRR